jgi:hypothetical protein
MKCMYLVHVRFRTRSGPRRIRLECLLSSGCRHSAAAGRRRVSATRSPLRPAGLEQRRPRSSPRSTPGKRLSALLRRRASAARNESAHPGRQNGMNKKTKPHRSAHIDEIPIPIRERRSHGLQVALLHSFVRLGIAEFKRRLRPSPSTLQGDLQLQKEVCFAGPSPYYQPVMRFLPNRITGPVGHQQLEMLCQQKTKSVRRQCNSMPG